LVGVVIIVAFVFGKPLKSKQVVAQPPRVVKQVVYRAPKPLTPLSFLSITFALQPSLVMFVLILIPLRFLLILSVAIVANIQ
jgi:hypothetical protein